MERITIIKITNNNDSNDNNNNKSKKKRAVESVTCIVNGLPTMYFMQYICERMNVFFFQLVFKKLYKNSAREMSTMWYFCEKLQRRMSLKM